jgi:hypothetical protein
MWPLILSLWGKIPFQEIGDWMHKYWYLVAITVLVSSNLYADHKFTDVKHQLAAEQIAHKKDVQDFRDAQKAADAKAKAAAESLKKEAKANADQADSNYGALLAKYRLSLVRYKANQSGTSGPYYYQLPAPQGGDGPSPSAKLPEGIGISSADAEICAVNTARLQAVHDWAISLKK